MTTEFIKSFTSFAKLPIPYIESIEVHNENLVVQAAYHIRMTEQEYLYKDEIASSSTLPDGTIAGLLPRLNWVLQLVMNRDVPDTEIGKMYAASNQWPNITNPGWTAGTSMYFDAEYKKPYIVKGYSDAATGTASVLETIGTFDDSGFLVTRGNATDLRAIIDSDLVALFESLLTYLDETYSVDFFTSAGYSDDDISSISDYAALLDSQKEAKLSTILQYLIDEKPVVYMGLEAYWAKQTLAEEDYDARAEERVFTLPTTGIDTIHLASNYADFVETDENVQSNGDVVVIYKHSVTVFAPWAELWYRAGDYGLKKMGLLSYSTDMSEAELIEAKTFHDDADPERFLRNSRISEASVTTFQKNGKVVQEPLTVYRESNGNTYPNPLQSIDKQYYGQEKITLENIISTMSGIADRAISSSRDEELRTAAEGLQYVLSTNTKNIGVLIELNNYRKAFANKSSVTSVGAFYEEFKSALYSANKIIQEGTPLTKSRVTNPVVKDMRDFEPGTLYSGYYDDYSVDDDYIDVDSVIWSRTTEVYSFDASYDGDDYDETEEGSHLGGYKYALIDNGYWFFNYEKALKTQSTLSRLIDVTKFEKFFGAKMTNRAFRLGKFSVQSRVAWPSFGDDATEGMSTGDVVELREGTGGYAGKYNWYTTNILESLYDYEDDYPKQEYTISRNDGSITIGDSYDLGDFFALWTKLETGLTTRDEYSESATVDSVYGGAFWQDEEQEYSFLNLRPFQLISNETGYDPNLNISNIDYAGNVPLHRIMAFEYQKRSRFSLSDTDYSGTDDGSSTDQLLVQHNKYQFFVARAYMFDETGKLLAFLADLVISTKEALDEYVAAAEDKCAFNEDEGYFNKFFVDAVNARFPDVYEAPYVTAPIVFFMMNDLLYDTYDGSLDLIYAAARETIASISPETGTLSALQHFQTNFETLYDAWTETGSGTLYDTLVDRDGTWVETYSSLSDMGRMAWKGRRFGFNADDDDTIQIYVPYNDYDNYPTYGETEEPADESVETEVEYTVDTDGSCFIAGTMILMADGTQKKIEDVKIGDVLMGEKGSHNTVLDFDRPNLGSRQLYSINGSEPFVTADHPLRAVDGWRCIHPPGTEGRPRKTLQHHIDYYGVDHGVETTQLVIGDVLIKIAADGISSMIEKIDSVVGHNMPDQVVYNFMLDGNHTYYADGYLTHNSCADEVVFIDWLCCDGTTVRAAEGSEPDYICASYGGFAPCGGFEDDDGTEEGGTVDTADSAVDGITDTSAGA
jgi:hypothetical protein